MICVKCEQDRLCGPDNMCCDCNDARTCDANIVRLEEMRDDFAEIIMHLMDTDMWTNTIDMLKFCYHKYAPEIAAWREKNNKGEL